MVKKIILTAVAVIILLGLSIWLWGVIKEYNKQKTVEEVNKTLQFSGIKLLMDTDEIEKNVPYSYNKHDIINGRQINFEAAGMSAVVFLYGRSNSKYYNKVVYIITRNSEHQVFGFTMLTPTEQKKKALEKHGFRYKKNGVNYYSKNGVNIRIDSHEWIIIWVDNPDDLMSKW